MIRGRRGGDEDGDEGERCVHRGVHWYRDARGNVSFYDASGSEWVRWARGVDAPPLPPRWQLLGVPTRVTRPGWRSPWRVIPLLLLVAVIIIAVFQSVPSSSGNTAAEAKAATALLGQCLARTGSKGFSSKAVACTSAKAAVKVVQVVPTTPGSPTCPSSTVAVELAYPGVRYLHQECVVAVTPGG